MDLYPSPTCDGCGRTFGQYNALTNHQRSCKKTNKRTSDALNKFQGIIETRKKRRLDHNSHADATQLHLSPSGGTRDLVPKTVRFGGLGLEDVSQI